MATILVVESRAELGVRVARFLNGRGHRAPHVPTAEIAARIVFAVKPDLILLDIDAEVYCGLDFHEILAASPRGKGIAVVYLSGKCNWIQREWARRNGALALIHKSTPAAQIAVQIEEALGTLPFERSIASA